MSLLINRGSKTPPEKLFFAKVISFDYSKSTVDIAIIDDDRYIYDCKIACSMPSSYNYGSRYLPSFNSDDNEVSYVMSPGDIYCVGAWMGDFTSSVVLGFLLPNENELSIREQGLYLFRHESDVIVMIRGDGTTELYHPSGGYIKFGEDDTNNVQGKSLAQGGLYPQTAQDFRVRKTDEYNSKKNTGMFIRMNSGQQVTLNSDGEIILQTQNAASKITMTPDGVVSIDSSESVNVTTKDVNINTSGNLNASVDGNANLIVAGDTTLDTDHLDLTIPVGEMKINGYTGKTGVGHEHSGSPQFYVVNGIEIEGTYP